ncbi:FecCD family ABC transporter permease [Ornithinibacillus xuwenensis]|uniref:Iron ABC transporter permease n=1 Tax=Ornithinibacillus xuwenensis TaxID=3144668 RepID=A0ABU9XIC2_9BACI
MKRKERNPIIVLSVLFFLILLCFFVSLNLGYIGLGPLDVVKTIFGAGTDQQQLILFEFRLPRMVLALLIGAGLAIAGAVLQGITQNDLADPGIIGINTGAGLAVVLFIFFFQGSITSLNTLSIFVMPFAALIGGSLAALLIYLLAWKDGISPMRLILVGIGINAALGAVLIVFQLKMNPDDFMQATIWLSGSIWGADWRYVLTIIPWVVLLIPLAIIRATKLNALTLGDDVATGIGVAVERERRILLAISVALAGSCVAVGGGIAFLGLVAPHIARKIIGVNHQLMLPATALIGALLLLIADTIGRNVLGSSEIPVGLVVSAIGGLYFIYLLIKVNRKK